jgi:hypothetical protein
MTTNPPAPGEDPGGASASPGTIDLAEILRRLQERTAGQPPGSGLARAEVAPGDPAQLARISQLAGDLATELAALTSPPPAAPSR